LPQPQPFCSADALATLFLVLLVVLTSVASVRTMGDTISLGIISVRDISEAAIVSAVSMAVGFMVAGSMVAAATGEREGVRGEVPIFLKIAV
jgi:hypothetical protein